MRYLIPPKLLFPAVAAGYRLWPCHSGGWLTVKKGEEEFCTVLKDADVDEVVRLFL